MTVKEKLVARAKELGIETDKLTIAKLKEAIAAAEAAEATEVEKTPEPAAAEPAEEAEPQPPAAETEEAEVPAGEEEARFAKAGRRSRKSVTEAEAEAKRQAKKQSPDEEKPAAPKKAAPPTRPRSERRHKKYKEAAKKVDPKKIYAVDEALELVVKTGTTKFDSSVDLVVALGVNSKLADQNIRDSVMLPAGTGKDIRIAVFAEDEEAAAALAAGADIAGKEVFLQQLDKGVIDFDVLIAMPQLMAALSKYAKLLGPKGLMPNPKSGTIAKDAAKAVKEAKAGRVEYRVDAAGLVHLSIGKVSFGSSKLKDNFEAVFESIKNNKPASLKGTYVKSIHLSTTMGPGLRTAVPV